jgi:hypothetical protein
MRQSPRAVTVARMTAAPLPEDLDYDPTAATPRPSPPINLGKTLAIIVATIAAIAGLVFVIWYNSDAQQATRACEAYLRDEVLRAPSTAKFSSEEFFDTDRPEVTGDVDAQNGFGAMLRSSFSCSMEKRAGDWVVTDGYVD